MAIEVARGETPPASKTGGVIDLDGPNAAITE
jgi:hypothetical protein